MNATFTISSEGLAVVTGRAVAYDEAAVWTFTGVSVDGLTCRLVGVLKSDYPTMTTAFNHAIALGSGTSVAFTVNLSNTTVDSYIVRDGLPCLVAVIDQANGKVLAAGEITIEAVPTPTGAVIVDIEPPVAAWGDISGTLTDQLDLVAYFEAKGVAAGLVAAHVAAHPVPTARDTRNEAADAAIQTHIIGTGSPHTAAGVGADATGTAAGLMTAHTTAHPAPTSRDTRNEAADAAIQTHIGGTGSPHTAAGVGADPAGSANTVQGNLNTHTTTHPAPTTRDARNAVAGANADITSLAGLTTPLSVGQGGTGAATAVAALAALGAVAGDSGTTLPTGGDIVTGQVFRLTAADGTALAPPGLYQHDGTRWHRLTPTQRSLTFAFSGGGAAIETATQAVVSRLPWNFTPTAWSIVCSAAVETAAAAAASVAVALYVDDWSTAGVPSTGVGGTSPSVTTAVGATAATDFTASEWAAGQSVLAKITGTPTAYWATLTVEGYSWT